MMMGKPQQAKNNFYDFSPKHLTHLYLLEIGKDVGKAAAIIENIGPQ